MNSMFTMTSDEPIVLTARFMERDMQRLCIFSGCMCTTKRIGVFKKRFTIHGTREQRADFLQLAWDNDLPGVRNEILRKGWQK
jgi:hypothetical protein